MDIKRQKINFTPETHLLEGDVSEKIVTLYISAHGSSILDSRIPRDLAKKVNILNFAGGIHTTGLMLRKCPELTIGHEPGTGCSGVTLPGPQLDIMALQYIHHVYHDLSQSSDLTASQVSKRSLKTIYDNIPLVYANVKIPYFHNHEYENITTEPQAPFTMRHPTINKYYSMYPVEHENCSSTKEECSEGRCRLRPREEQRCPEYGITVVHSTQEEDMPYTLAGVSKSDNSTRVNLNDPEGHKGYEGVAYSHSSTYEYWKQRLNEHIDSDIEQINLVESKIPGMSKKELDVELDKIYGDEYLTPKAMADKTRELRNANRGHDIQVKKLNKLRNKLTGKYEDVVRKYEAMASELTEQHKPSTYLSDIIDVFISMGFDKIHIIDPTCNSCEFPETPEKGNGYYKAMGSIVANDIWSRIASGLRPQYNRPAAEYYTDDFDYKEETSVREPTIKKKWTTIKKMVGDEDTTTGTLKRGRSVSFGGSKCKTRKCNRSKCKTRRCKRNKKRRLRYGFYR